ncbi:MAG: MFS transporter, partial [Myxococcota bacterium]
FGQMGMAASLGFVVGPALAGLLSDTPWGYAAPVSAAIALSAVATGLCLGIVEPPRANLQEPQEPPALPRLLGQQHRRCDAVVQPPRQGSLTRFPVAGLLVSTFVQFLAFNLFYVAFPLHAEGVLGWTGRTMGLFFAVMSGVMLIAQGPLLAMLTARLPPSWVFGLGTGVLVLSFASFAIPGASIPFLGAVLFALGNGVAWPTFQDRIADAAGDEEQGAVQGAATSAGAFASILGLLAGGFLYPHFGAGLFLVAAFLYAVIGAATPLWFSSRAGPTTG